MAIKYGTNATLRLAYESPNSSSAGTIPSLVEQGDYHSKLRCSYDEYTLTADLAANDIIYLMKLPKGARVINLMIDSSDLDAQSAGALTVGWLGNGVDSVSANGFMTSIDVHTAGKAQDLGALLFSNQAGKFKRFGAETQVTVTISGETDATTGVIKVAILYVLD